MAFWLLIGFLILLSSFLGKVAAITTVVLSALGFAIWLWKYGGKRRKEIQRKYDPPTAQRILAREYWIGQTREQLRDSIGLPEKIETQQTSTRSKEIWKFFHKDPNRIRLKITMTNGVVSQIDEK